LPILGRGFGLFSSTAFKISEEFLANSVAISTILFATASLSAVVAGTLGDAAELASSGLGDFFLSFSLSLLSLSFSQNRQKNCSGFTS